MIVVDHDDQRVGSAVLTDAFKCTKNVYGIEDVIEKNVVECFIQLEFFRIAHYETQVRVLALRDFHHGAADLYPDAIGWWEPIATPPDTYPQRGCNRLWPRGFFQAKNMPAAKGRYQSHEKSQQPQHRSPKIVARSFHAQCNCSARWD